MKWRLLICLAVLTLTPPVHAQTRRIDPAGISGSLLLCGSYKPTPEMFEEFVEQAGGAKAKIVIITFDKAKWGAPPTEGLSAAAKKVNAAEPAVVDYADAVKAFPQATGLWLHVDSVSPMKDVMNDGKLAAHCRALVKNGAVIGSAAAGTRYLGTRELAANAPPCMNLLPDSLITIRQKGKPARPAKGDSAGKGLVAYEIDSEAAMFVKGRTIRTLGAGSIHVYLPNMKTPLREIVRERTGKDDPRQDKDDVTALRRAAHDRATGFPPKKVAEPFVEKGTLVIVGGGGSPAGLYPKFIDYAGGKGKAVIAIFPTANEGRPNRDSIARAFEKAGAKKATVLYGRTQAEVESKEFLDTLKEATGLWFDGGRQWRFVDCYENTKALPLMFDVLNRDGVIGGTSAGATIQGDYLARGGVFNNFDIRYEGYERGLGFLKGVAIDQHFSQRKRLPEMTKLMKTYPQYLGIGIDEATAIVVKGSIADVIGKGRVHFYDAHRKVEKGDPDYQALSAGGQYDLRERKVLAEGK